MAQEKRLSEVEFADACEAWGLYGVPRPRRIIEIPSLKPAADTAPSLTMWTGKRISPARPLAAASRRSV